MAPIVNTTARKIPLVLVVMVNVLVVTMPIVRLKMGHVTALLVGLEYHVISLVLTGMFILLKCPTQGPFI